MAAGSWLVGLLPSAAGGSASGVAVGLTLLLAMPASALSAYLAGRVLTPRPWPRALVAVLWALLPVLTQGLAEGRVGIVAPHVLLPLVVAGVVRTMSGEASWTVVAATTLALAVAGAFAPMLLVLGALAGLALLVRGPGRSRLAGLVLALGPAAALGPALLRWWHTPALLLTGPGLTQWGGPSATALPWQLALLWPSNPDTWSDSTPVPGPVGSWLPMVLPLLTVPVVAGGVLALVRRGRVSAGLWTLGALTVTGLVLALVAPRVTIGRAYLDARPGHTGKLANLTTWPGVPLDLAAIGLLGALLVVLGSGSGGLVEGRWRRGLRVGATGVAAAGLTLCALALAVVLGYRTMGATITTAGDAVPQAARDQLSSPLANRYLVVEVRGGRLGYELWSDASGTLARELPTGEAPPAVETEALDRALASGSASTAGPDAAAALADLGVGFVGVTSATEAPVITRLDTTAGLSRAAGEGEINLWRVLPRTSPTHGEAVPSSRLRLVDPAGVPLAMVPVSGPGLTVDTELDAADATAGARLVAAQDPRWSAAVRVSADGRTIAASPGTGYPSYVLPQGAKHLQVESLAAHSWWWWATIAWVGLLLLLALPFGTRSRQPGAGPAREGIA
ncbi:hypothetical protein [Arsenicicoccus piscis]|uniref:Glycosyl transferase n=1 Tax=Arsenicicoccus piscis TaxID=673954 RepID=A0ABQ6HK35_9MICO|nr:hypothetical protein [Arsenicicoccus piscis]GMA18532.1 hypothetical protein GCM10025862_05530 [Arsenicicoccus piscis]